MELKIKIHPLFIIFAFFLIFFGWTRILISYFLVLILHELGHYFMAKFLGYKLNKIVFMPYGVSLNGQGNIFKKRDEILIAMAGPVVNFLLCILTVTLWWLFPVTYYYTDAFVFSNLSLALFNLIPVFPLDGGRLLVAICSIKISKFKVLKTMKILSVVGSILFLILFILSAFNKINITLFFIAVFLFSSSLDGNNSYVYERAYTFLNKSNKKPLEVKMYVVNKKVPLNDVVKLISGNHYVIVSVVDDNFKQIKIITENDIINKI